MYGEGCGNINKKNIMETIKKEAIELLKKETTKMKELRIKNGEFEFKGECADAGESYSELVLDGLGGMRYSIHDYDAEGTLLGIWKKEFGKIQPGDYFIARKPKRNSAPLSWCASMDKYDGIIQKCERISFYGSIVSGDPWVFFHPDWCEKVNTGDVMKTQFGNLFIFKCVSGGYYRYFIYCSMRDGKPISLDFADDPFTCRVVHATPEEVQVLFDALKKQGEQWNAEKMCVEDIPKPKTDEECLRAWGCGEKEINDYLKYREKYEKVLKELQDNSKGYIDSLNARKIFGQLRIIADLHESSTPDRSDVLKKVIKLCEKLLNDEG